jgi:Flp pilus assembly protein TadG
MKRFRSDTGAVAVEFAIVLIPLMLILLGVIDFGRIYTQQISLTAAARQGARVMALQTDGNATADQALAVTAVQNATSALSPALTNSQVLFTVSGVPANSPQVCPANPVGTPPDVTVTAKYPLTFITGLPNFVSIFSGNQLPAGRQTDAQGGMRCGG